jgi:hypothetical protein
MSAGLKVPRHGTFSRGPHRRGHVYDVEALTGRLDRAVHWHLGWTAAIPAYRERVLV